ncbi:MAG: lipocalin-like domain-containing protein [Bacteroidaceae bacterium]|nr:lipocalin-like domain-containing protein [Bacteroidaceae bacterium]
MKTFFASIFIATALLCGVTSCDKVEDNGRFAGMWQLTEWKRLPDGQVVADRYKSIYHKEYDGIYYSVQLDLMAFNGRSQYLARFRRTADSLFIGTVYHGPKDDIVDYDALADYGVPGDGKFAIDKLTRSALVLRSDTAQLTFRKY